MRKLSNENLILLDALIYAISDAEFLSIKGQTIQNVLEMAQKKLKANQLPIMIGQSGWTSLLNAIQPNYWLCAHRIVAVYHDELATAFVLESPTQTNYTLIFRGTVNLVEWWDNFKSMVISTEVYEKVRDFVEGLPEEYGDLLVSGHSRGGKFAVYTAIVCPRIERAVAVNTPGFSAEFIVKHRARIDVNQNKIEYIDQPGDIVHFLGVRLPGNVITLHNSQEIVSPYRNHMPDVMLDSYGHFVN